MAFEVEHLWNGWVKKDKVKHQSNAIGLTLDTPIDFAFSPCLTTPFLRQLFFKWTVWFG